jgi:hypothetical protein
LGDRLDAAVSGTDLGAARLPAWCGPLRVLQWLLVAVTLTGLVWSGVWLASGRLQDADPQVAGFALPLVLAAGGLAVGIVLAVVGRILVGRMARARADLAEQRLRAGIDEVARELVIEPVAAELQAYTTVRDGLARAQA